MSIPPLTRWQEIVREKGWSGLALKVAAHLYARSIRRLLPATPVQLAGLPGPDDRRLGDQLLSDLLRLNIANDQPLYEATLIGALRRLVQPGDRVTVVGGGKGITAVVAAQQAGQSGTVICYEASPAGVLEVRRAAERNRTAIDIREALVGPAVHVYGAAVTRHTVPPASLPDCDVLELDCEGSEVTILREMTIRPRAIVVETHGFHGAPTSATRALLDSLGYVVEDLGIAEPGFPKFCADHDIRVLAATRR